MTRMVREREIMTAMAFFEVRAGLRDGITIAKEVSKLADVLGVMWHEKTATVILENDHPVCALLVEAGLPRDAGDSDDDTQETFSGNFSGKGHLRCSPTNPFGVTTNAVVMKARVDKETGCVRVCGGPIRIGADQPFNQPLDDYEKGWDPLVQPDPISGVMFDDVAYEDDAGATFEVVIEAGAGRIISQTEADLAEDSNDWESENLLETPTP